MNDRRLGCFPSATFLVFLMTASGLQLEAAVPQADGPDPAHRELIDRYCIGCHNDQARTGGLSLENLELERAASDAGTWEKVVRKLRGGMMPPQAARQPDEENVRSFVTWLEGSLDAAVDSSPDPGPASLHRLNRTEYGNAIRDLLDLEVDVTELLPADDESHGFDNIADVLRVSPSLLEQYLAAARKISSLAVGDPEAARLSSVYRIPPDLPQDRHVEGLPLGTRGGTLIRHNFPVDGEYQFSVFLLRNIVGYMTGLEWPHELEISIDGERVFLAPVGGEEDNAMSDANFAAAGNTIDERLRTRVRVQAGPRLVGISFIRKNSAESQEPLELHTRDHDLQNMNGIPIIDYIDVTGPFTVEGSGDTPSRRRIFTCRPTASTEESACAREILRTLARRAYRRPVTESDMERILDFYGSGHERGGFETGIQDALQFILASPDFIFRSEPDPEGMAPGTIYPLGELALASRLSFFLWSSIPDETLLDLAEAGQLSDPAVFDAQVRRMVADPRADALVRNFAGQWLFLRNLQSVRPDTLLFPNFDDSLRQAFRTETELLFRTVIREDRSVVDLLDADYTYVNERLAAHYGIPNVYGSHFRRVAVEDDARRGLLGHGSILSVTSYPNRTSPVLRGKWILENILGTPPPAPPPNVPQLEENAPGVEPRSLRERLEQHRENPVCAACHSMIDPAGLALENFDAIGRWRDREEGGAIDPSGRLTDGTAVDGPVALREALLDRSDQFVGTVTEKLLTYALGRGLEYYDMPVVRDIVRNAARQDYRFSSVIGGIVNSTPFRMKRSQGEAVVDTATR